MIISILNCDKEYGIGKRNGLLFSLPKDMKFFRETTLNHVVCMGENTLLSFPNSKPLKNRTNIVLSQDPTHNYEGVINVHTFDDFLRAMKEHSENDEFAVMRRLNEISGVPVPRNLAGLESAEVLHTDVIGKEDMLGYVLGYLAE